MSEMSGVARSFPFGATGIAFATAAAVAITPIGAPLAAQAGDTAVRLSAMVQQMLDSVDDGLASVAGWASDLVSGSPAGLAATTLDAAGNFLVPVADFIQGAYTALEPWVEYGFQFASWAAGWVPFVGLLAPQINIFYNLGESVVQSLVFNTTDWISGQIGFLDGLSSLGTATSTALGIFVNQQVDWIQNLLPPFPPIGAPFPPLPFAAGSGFDLAAAGLPALLQGALPDAGLGLGALPGAGGDLAGHLGDLGALLLSLIA